MDAVMDVRGRVIRMAETRYSVQNLLSGYMKSVRRKGIRGLNTFVLSV
jgi:hypothetical protein